MCVCVCVCVLNSKQEKKREDERALLVSRNNQLREEAILLRKIIMEKIIKAKDIVTQSGVSVEKCSVALHFRCGISD